MVWVILGVLLSGASVARPASRPQALATTPWAVAHATAMIGVTVAGVTQHKFSLNGGADPGGVSLR